VDAAITSGLAGTVLRFNPRCPWRNENTGKTDHIPTLIVPFRSIDDDSIIGIHRIALRDDGTKLGRRMLGVVHRAAIKFDEVESDSLAVGEGVETAMAARQLGFAPVWALGSVGAISFFPLIERVKQLFILSESGDASARAVRLCGTRWHRARRKVRIVIPDIGSDLNDVLARSFP
jgi:putative DNA primase/helicase